jgi:hypothetical protein
MKKRGQQYITPLPGLEDAVAMRDLDKMRTILKDEWHEIRERERDAIKTREWARVDFLRCVADMLGFKQITYKVDGKGILVSYRLHVDLDMLADERFVGLFDDQ